MRITAYADTDKGRVREGNEDFYYAGTSVFAVADGMGGHQAGEVASEIAIEPISELDGVQFRDPRLAERTLVEAIRSANRTVVDKAQAEPSYKGMGTTLTAVLVRDDRLHVAHVGDSRAYLLRPGETISQLTTDHTLVEQLVQEGRLSRDEAASHPQRSVITRAIGVDEDVEVDTLPPLALQPGDQVLLCSDGLTGPVDDDEIADILESTPDGDAACRALIDAANAGGGPDNITVVLLRVDADDQRGGGRSAAAAGAARAPAAALTEDLRDVRSPGGVAAAGDDPGLQREPSIQIRTRQETGQDWATSMGRYGAPQGVEARPTPTGGRGRRAVALLLGAAILLIAVAAGGWLLLSRAYFVGDDDGGIAIFHGIPQQVATVHLYWLAEDTDLRTDDLPPRLRDRVREGITVASLGEGRDLVGDFRTAIEEGKGIQPEPAASPDAGEAEPDPTPVPRPTP